MDFRVIADYLEERRQNKKPFILHYARISKEGELLCDQFKMCIKDDYGWPMLEFLQVKIMVLLKYWIVNQEPLEEQKKKLCNV